MRKNKDGQVIASLTEVKNKTGDIFALADEYGEVLLTSYNKPRYKIVKIDIDDVLDLSGGETSRKQRTENKKPELKPVDEIHQPIVEVNAEKVVVAQKVEEPEKKGFMSKTISITRWERDGKTERAFVQKATKNLIS